MYSTDQQVLLFLNEHLLQDVDLLVMYAVVFLLQRRQRRRIRGAGGEEEDRRGMTWITDRKGKKRTREDRGNEERGYPPMQAEGG